MAGAGGNVVSFSRHFGHVNAIEIDTTRFKCMVNNFGLFKCHNVSALNGDYLTIFPLLKQDVIFLDPPWGGKQYKEQEHTHISLQNGKVRLEEFCKKIIDMHICKLLVLKLPINFDINCLRSFSKMKIYDLKKMMLVLIYVNT